MVKKSKKTGFEYFLEEDIIKAYRKKPYHLRLEWLYMGNLLRKECGEKVIRLHNKFRLGKIK